MICKQATLIINGWDSQCVNCGQDANCTENQHLSSPGYGPPQVGCGITWENVTSAYMGMEDKVKQMKPDLQYVEFSEIVQTLYNAQLQTAKKRK
jgi:hypothetical protein